MDLPCSAVSVFFLAAVMVVLSTVTISAANHEFYVSPAGKSNATGIATLEHPRNAIRLAKITDPNFLHKSCKVFLRQGICALSERVVH